MLWRAAWYKVYIYRRQRLLHGPVSSSNMAPWDPPLCMQDAASMPYLQAWQSGKSVGVPGVVALYEKAHEQHGRLPWSRLFQPAIRLAETGFEVSPRLADMLLRVAKFTRLDENPGAADYFYPNGEALIAGQLRKNPEYASTLRALAEEGIGTFYGGALAEQIVAAAQAQPNPGSLQRSDLERYAVRVRPVVEAERNERGDIEQ